MRKEILIIFLGLLFIIFLIDEINADTHKLVSEKPVVEVFVFSHCPYGLQFEKALSPVYALLKNKAEIKIVAIGMLHGEYEKKESLRQICIEKIYGKDKLWDYLNEFIFSSNIGLCKGKESCVNHLIEDIFIYNDINLTDINNCIKDDAETLYNGQNKRASELNISGSPTFLVNGFEVEVTRTSEDIKNKICEYFKEIPTECSVLLSRDMPSPGFGNEYMDPEYIQDGKILVLESWKNSLMKIIDDILSKLADYESRIKILENKTCECEIMPSSSYFKYLSASDRKKIVCGYAEDKHLTAFNDLNLNCTISYKKYKS